MDKPIKRKISFITALIMLLSASSAMTAETGMICAAAAPASETAEELTAAKQEKNAPTSVKINAANFPDPIFRSVISGSQYDRDGNGVLDQTEIGLTLNIYCEHMGIKSLKGVEYFTYLQGLWCMDNEIEELDISALSDLRGLWCSSNELTSLDMTHNPELVWVYCYDCHLTDLDVSKNPKMAFIETNDNPLGELDVTHNPELEHLICNCCGISELDISKNPKLAHLDAFNNPDMPDNDPLRNHLTKLDLSHNPKMKRLDIWDNPGLGNVDISCCPGLQYYNCAHNNIKSLDLSHNPELVKLNCAYNKKIKKLDLSHNPKLVYLDCADNQIQSLDLSKNNKLYFLQAFINDFTTLDIGYNPLLIKTYNEGVTDDVFGLATEWKLDYGGDTSTGGDNILFLSFDDKVKLSTKPKYTAPTKAEVNIPAGASKADLITRESAAQVLYEMAGKPNDGVSKSRFKDVKSGAWYEDALLWGEKYSICAGSPDISSDTFGVGEWITRQDLMLMLMRYSEYRDYKRSIDFGRADDFMDYYDVDYYAWEAVTWAATWNILVGKGDPKAPKEKRLIEPHTAATRQDMKDLIGRMMEVNSITSYTIPTIPSPETDAPLTKYGDLDGDGAIDIYDVALLQQYVSKWNVKIDKAAADVTADGRIDIYDVARLQQYVSRWNVKLGK